MWPPTPTPMPPGMANFDLENVYSLWTAAPTAIQVWNWTGDLGKILQLIILVAVVLAGIFVVYRSVQQLIRRDAEN